MGWGEINTTLRNAAAKLHDLEGEDWAAIRARLDAPEASATTRPAELAFQEAEAEGQSPYSALLSAFLAEPGDTLEMAWNVKILPRYLVFGDDEVPAAGAASYDEADETEVGGGW